MVKANNYHQSLQSRINQTLAQMEGIAVAISDEVNCGNWRAAEYWGEVYDSLDNKVGVLILIKEALY